MNAKVFLCLDRRTGLVSDAWVEAAGAGEPLGEVADATGRGKGPDALCVARVVPKLTSFKRSLYLDPAEQTSLDLYHRCRQAVQDVGAGRAVGDAAAIRLAAIFRNLQQWTRIRSFDASITSGLLGAGWWLDYRGSTKDLTELSAMIRAVQKAAATPADSIESPYYEPAEMEGETGETGEREPFRHEHLDGTWARLLDDGTLEMRDPNDGQDPDPDAKCRHQYRVLGGVLHSRRLPPQAVGDVWRGADGPDPFIAVDSWPPIPGILDAFWRYHGGDPVRFALDGARGITADDTLPMEG